MTKAAERQQQFERIRHGDGFVAALDQSGGSTPRALERYGIGRDAYTTDAEMFDLVHQMRTRIVTSPIFDGGRILAAILFENTMNREIDGLGSAAYLWLVKRVVPFLKVDQGLADETDGVRLMNPIPGLDELLTRGIDEAVFGTKTRSVIKLANPAGVDAVVEQQFEVAQQILTTGLVPILEPEVDVHSPEKATAERLLNARILARLDKMPRDQHVILKLTIPSEDNLYRKLIDHPRVLRVLALSGGYDRREANKRLARNSGLIASFSRALIEGLTAQHRDKGFDAALDAAIASILEASRT